MANEVKERLAAEKHDAFMQDLKNRGIIKDRSPEEQAAYEKRQAEIVEDSPPWTLIIGLVVGIVVLMLAMGLGITWLILKYADVS